MYIVGSKNPSAYPIGMAKLEIAVAVDLYKIMNHIQIIEYSFLSKPQR
jgi:hypothetical protein